MSYQLPLLGIPEIDDQHRHLITCLERLELWVGKGHGFAAALDAFTALNAYVVQHFKDEEAVFKAADYPKLQEHVEEHERLVSELGKLYQQVLDGGDVSEALLAMVRDWLVTHIGKDDMDFAVFKGLKPAQ